jgi:DNA-binding winged helix-turn-helix (wHTH) protein
VSIIRVTENRQFGPSRSGTFVDFDNSLNTSINKLREALGDSAERPRFIENLPRRGYRFIAPETAADGTAKAARTSVSTAAPAPRWKMAADVPRRANEAECAELQQVGNLRREIKAS